MDNWEELEALLEKVRQLPLDEMYAEAEKNEHVAPIEHLKGWGQRKNQIRILRGALKWV